MVEVSSSELEMLRLNKQSGYNYQERRHDNWNENYMLFRDNVIIDRLIQRQSVNIPIMKQSIWTLLKDVDDMPVLYFENIDNDKQAEVFQNEHWNYTVEDNNLEVQDIVDKKQVFLFGRSFMQFQIMNGKIVATVQDPMDMLVDRYVDPTNLNTSRFLIHQHIYRPLSYLEKNPDYDQEAIKRLREWYGTEAGLIKQANNTESAEERNEKMRDLGLSDVDDPILGETIVEMSLHFVFRSESKDEEDQIYVYAEAEDREILMKKTQEDIIDPHRRCKDHFWRNHYSYDTWADDVERQDFWSDSKADVMRQPNKIANAWMSQEVENRTLANLGMNFYDATIEGFVPGSFEPMAFGWYGVPGKPSEVMQKVDVAPLTSNMDAINFIIDICNKATGATTTQQGATEDRQITLGEVQLALGEAKERIKGMSKFYTPAWKRRGLIYLKLIEAGYDQIDTVKIYKKGRNTDDIYSRDITPKDWMTENGYNCKVWSQEEKNTRDINTLQKLNVAKGAMPLNTKLDNYYKRKLLEFADLPPSETNSIMEEEKQRSQSVSQFGVGGIDGQAIPPASNRVPNQNMPVQV